MDRRRLAALLFGMAVIVALTLLRAADPYAIRVARETSFDVFQQVQPRSAPPDLPIRIIDIDESSLAALGQWPWPRFMLADMATRLTEMGAAAIAFDVLFSEPDRLVQEVIRDQAAFDEALANVNSTGELPTVNFETSMVVGATTWRLKGCTTDLKIKSVEERANDVSVTLMLHNHCISLGAESWPYVFAEIPRIDKPFVFTETEIWDECPE